MSRRYTASLSRSQGRTGYSVIFRHPVRDDPTTGKAGLRVRRGLGTRDEVEATNLTAELNELLGDARYHDPRARSEAEARFSARVVDIFFDGMATEPVDFEALREEAIALPPKGEADGYRHALMLGTTGAGKTTLVRQLIGTDPETERFPSTSTSRTTIHDTEVVLDGGPWRGVVTFVPLDEVREYLNDCISRAVLEASRGADDATVLRYLLRHVDQRFRFNYILGNGPRTRPELADFDDFEEELDEQAGGLAVEMDAAVDQAATDELLDAMVPRVRHLADGLQHQLRDELDAGEEDERVVEELFEEQLDATLREEDLFHEIADSLIDEIEKRFALLPEGRVTRTRHGWPLVWEGQWPADERKSFVDAMARFSSNYAPAYGSLLTPLVNGMRAAGPFRPEWSEVQPRLVLLDGEGLGHTPKSSSSVSNSVVRRIDAADAVVLVDNAVQPMQAAPLAALREVLKKGDGRKLVLAFTHFDEVKGDNLPTIADKAQHVLDSAQNALAAIGEDLGPFAERMLRQRIDEARFFLGDLHRQLLDSETAGRRTVGQLNRLLQAVDRVVERPEPPAARPVYDRMNLAIAIHAAAVSFHLAWRSRLGIGEVPTIEKEHWTRIKALCRRLGTMAQDHYSDLHPVANLRSELQNRLYVFVQNPIRWEGTEPDEDEQQTKYDALAENLSRRVMDLALRRVWLMSVRDWARAYRLAGRGSTFVRARLIDAEIYGSAAPVPGPSPSPNRNGFLREVVVQVEEAMVEVGALLT